MARITILGMGYIGTSIGLALRGRKEGFEVVGHDRDHARALSAKKLGAVDRAEWNLPAALEKAGMVVVATPLNAMEEVFSQIVEFLEPGCIITDTASLKVPTLAWADAAFGDRFSYVGGDPIVGTSGDDRTPSGTLFQGRTYCVIAGSGASADAVDQVTRLVQGLGATPLFVDPVEHDSHLAAVGQLPALLATALVNVIGEGPAWRDGQRLAGPGFGAATAPALEDPAEQRAHFEMNRAALGRQIRAFRGEIDNLARLLDEDPEELQRALASAHQLRAAWTPGGRAAPEVPPVEIPRARDQFSNWFLGGLGGRGRRKD